MTKVLEVCVDLDGGGIDRYLYNFCTRMEDIDFDFAIVDSGKRGILEGPIEKMGSRIFKVPRLRSGILRNYTALKEIISKGKYDVVHSHLGYWSVISLAAAKRCGVERRVAHAHIASEPESLPKGALRRFLTFGTKLVATDLAACGIDAALWCWGKADYEAGKVTIRNNAIDTSDYAFSEQSRTAKRSELGIQEGALVIGHIGRLCEQKNQLRVLDIFANICHRDVNSILLLIGRGGDEYEKKLIDKSVELGIEDRIMFLGVREDVAGLLNAIDVIVFPSMYEGLPFTLVETQCNGLPAICSSTVSQYAKMSGAVEFADLSLPDDVWADRVVQLAKRGRIEGGPSAVAAAGYDISIESQALRRFYLG